MRASKLAPDRKESAAAGQRGAHCTPGGPEVTSAERPAQALRLATALVCAGLRRVGLASRAANSTANVRDGTVLTPHSRGGQGCARKCGGKCVVYMRLRVGYMHVAPCGFVRACTCE